MTHGRRTGQGRDPLPHGSRFRFDYQDSPSALDSARCRSAGSGELTSTCAPVTGCSNASRVACRNWRSQPEAPGGAVLGVAAHRVSDRLHVHADLVGAPGLEPQAQQRAVRERALEREVRARLARAGAADGHARAHARVAADRGLDRARPRRRAPLHEREIFALDQPSRERRLQAPQRPRRCARRRAARRCRDRGGGRCRGAPGLPHRRRRAAARAAARACPRGAPVRGARRRPAPCPRRSGARPGRRS